MKESPIKTERKTLHLPEDTVRALNKLAAKNGTDFSKEVRRAIDEYLDLETTAENIDMINGVIRQELSGQLKALGNRLAGLINRLTIISAAGYYANIAIIADLIDQDRYSSFEKIESAARKRALAFANQKNADALRTFMDDEEMQKAIEMLNEVKESIMNAYEIKSGLSRHKISQLMDAETWMNAKEAVKLGFADEILFRDGEKSVPEDTADTEMLFSRKAVTDSLLSRLIPKKKPEANKHMVPVTDLEKRLSLLAH